MVDLNPESESQLIILVHGRACSTDTRWSWHHWQNWPNGVWGIRVSLNNLKNESPWICWKPWKGVKMKGCRCDLLISFPGMWILCWWAQKMWCRSFGGQSQTNCFVQVLGGKKLHLRKYFHFYHDELPTHWNSTCMVKCLIYVQLRQLSRYYIFVQYY